MKQIKSCMKAYNKLYKPIQTYIKPYNKPYKHENIENIFNLDIF